MGNRLYADILVGKTLKEAKTFIKHNCVYLDKTDHKHMMKEIDVVCPDSLGTADYCVNRLSVKIIDGVISEIIGAG